MKKPVKLIAGLCALALLLSGCSSSVSSSESIAAQDIKDAVLSNLSGDCADYSVNYETAVKDVQRNLDFTSTVALSDDSTKCTLTANDIPNYDFNDGTGRFAEDATEQDINLTIARNPSKSTPTTELSLFNYSAVMLNGVVLDQVANGCYAPDDASADSDGNIANGCGLWTDWRLDPLGKVSLGTDSHNAHVQPGGLYHYHGDPRALYDLTDTSHASPVIGFAADGFPIYGTFFLNEATGEVEEATSGYTLKTGSRPTGENNPGGTYDGTYIQDYEFTDAGTLDKCNGMTVNGQYGYYVTKSYPYVMGCYSGTPDLSFFKFWGVAIPAISAFAIVGTLLIVVAFVLIRRRRIRRNVATVGSSL